MLSGEDCLAWRRGSCILPPDALSAGAALTPALKKEEKESRDQGDTGVANEKQQELIDISTLMHSSEKQRASILEKNGVLKEVLHRIYMDSLQK